MIICYEIVCSERHFEDYGRCSVFGLKAYEEGETCGESVCCVEDVSVNKQFVEELRDRLRRNDVHPIHLRDVILDVIS